MVVMRGSSLLANIGLPPASASTRIARNSYIAARAFSCSLAYLDVPTVMVARAARSNQTAADAIMQTLVAR